MIKILHVGAMIVRIAGIFKMMPLPMKEMMKLEIKVIDGIAMKTFCGVVITAAIEVDGIISTFDVEEHGVHDEILVLKQENVTEFCDCGASASWPTPRQFHDLDEWEEDD